MNTVETKNTEETIQNDFKENKIIENSQKHVAYISAFLGIFFVQFVLYGGSFGIATTLFFVMSISFSIIYFKKSDLSFSKYHIANFVILYIFSLNIFVTSNNLIKILNFIFCAIIFSYNLFCISIKSNHLNEFFIIHILKSNLNLPFQRFAGFIKVFQPNVHSKFKLKKILYIFLGLVTSLPLTFIVLSLLLEADDSFKTFINSIFNNINFSLNIPKNIFKLILIYIFSSFIFSIIYSNIKNYDNEYCDDKNSIDSLKIFNSTILYGMVTPIYVIYLTFFIFQLNYFLSAFMDRLPEGFSYAEYARRGFFELVAVAVINLFVMILLNVFCKYENKKPVLLKIYIMLLAVFTEILIITALSKMIMYISTLGFTSLRVYTSWFMILLALFFLLFIIKEINENINFFKAFCVIFIIMFSTISFGKIDFFIARFNIELYKNNITKEIDIYTLAELSNDAVIAIDAYTDDNDEYVATAAKDALALKASRLDEDIKVSSFDLSSCRSYKILNKYK
jgi:hypothetical protein